MAVVAQVVTLVSMTHRPRRPGADTAQSVRYSQPPVIEVVGSKRGRTESKFGFVKLPVTAKPKSAPPVPKVQQSPKAQVAEAVAQHVVQVIGVTGSKAKSMAAAVQLAVSSTSPRSYSKVLLTDTLNRIKGPPPKVVQVLVPYGAVTQVASKAPNAQLSEALLVKNVQLDPVLLLVLVSP